MEKGFPAMHSGRVARETESSGKEERKKRERTRKEPGMNPE
ncbi:MULTISPECIES: hypothetical protein [Paraburkholderia]|nr:MULTISPECIES: hypothetical protein [Paraburkholderia]MDH6146226.1 hypothetical protein [Paraburkholderia sp. WSM4179]